MKPDQVDDFSGFINDSDDGGASGTLEEAEKTVEAAATKTIEAPEGQGVETAEDAEAKSSATSPAEAQPRGLTAPTGGDPRLEEALATIARVTKENEELRQTRQPAAIQAPQGAPQVVDALDVLGYRVPKDRAKRDLQITNELLLELGWNDPAKGPAVVLETIINGLAARAMDVIPRTVIQSIENARRTETLRSRFEQQFFDLYPDLKDIGGEFLEAIEAKVREEGLARQYANEPRKYLEEIGKRTRTTVARLRGVTLDQYEAQLKVSGGGKPASGAAVNGTRGRGALSSTSGSRGGPRVKPTGQQAEIEDLL